MRVHVYQHVPFEGIDGMAAWVERGGHALSRTRFYAGDKPPPPGAHDFLIIMGGPMGVHDTGRHPWLAEEKRAIAAAIGSGQAVLGVCLGAQLIADVLGARVAPNREKEIGWLDVSLEPVPGGNPLAAGDPEGTAFTVFQWHGDTFEIPAGARRLAGSAACRNQAFLSGQRVLALQFHIEVTPAGVRGMVENGRAELVPGGSVQPEAAILGETRHFAGLQRRLFAVLDRLTG